MQLPYDAEVSFEENWCFFQWHNEYRNVGCLRLILNESLNSYCPVQPA